MNDAEVMAAPLGTAVIPRSSHEEMRRIRKAEEGSTPSVGITGARHRPVLIQAGLVDLFGSRTHGATIAPSISRPCKGPDGAMMRLAEETADDRWEVEALLDLCFVPGREALSSYRLRDGVAPVAGLCLVSREEDGSLAGTIRNWPVHIGATGERKRALLLGPVAVHPTRQGEGLGAALILRALELARQGGWSRVLLVGDLPYYRRFGFQKLEGVEMPPRTNPERVLGFDLREGAWAGVAGPVIPVLA